MENPIKMDDLGGEKTPIFGNTQMVDQMVDSLLEGTDSGWT